MNRHRRYAADTASGGDAGVEAEPAQARLARPRQAPARGGAGRHCEWRVPSVKTREPLQKHTGIPVILV